MKDYKNTPLEEEEYSMDENNPLMPLRNDNELFKDEDYIVQPLVQVKRQNKKDGEVWKILEDGKVSVLIPSNRLTNKEKEYLRTLSGFQFLIDGYKQGWRSVNKFKLGLK
jgi:hypothetical protein